MIGESPHPATNRERGGPGMRLAGLIRKECQQILRDPSSLAIAFFMPLFLLLLFGYGISLDATRVPLALVVEHPSAETSSLAGSFHGSRYFDIARMPTMRQAVQALQMHRVDGIVRVRANFAEEIHRGGQAPIQLIVNGVDANNARLITGYVEGAWAAWLESRARLAAQPFAPPVNVDQQVWFNSAVRSRNFLVPGLIAVIMTLIGALLTAMVMAREWERGTMEALMVTPVTIREILFGKLIPYFILGMGGMALSVVLAIGLFEVPFRGSFPVLGLASSLFLLVALSMGLLISIIAQNQFVAGQIALIVTYLPAVLLSGFLFPISSMPEPVQALTLLFAARYFVAIIQTLFLAGTVWDVILPNLLALGLMAIAFLSLMRLRARKRLE